MAGIYILLGGAVFIALFMSFLAFRDERRRKEKNK